MRLRPLVLATAATLLLQSPAFAQSAKPAAAPVKSAKAVKPAAAKGAKPAAKPMPEWVRMMTDVSAEVTLIVDPKAHPGEVLEKLAAIKFKPETAAQLMKYLGTAKLLEVQKITHADGSMTHNFATPNIDKKQDTGFVLQLAPLSGVMKSDKAGNAYTATGAMPFMGFADSKFGMRAENLTLTADLVRGPYDFWIGRQNFTLEKVTAGPAGKPAVFSLNGTHLDVEVKNQGNIAEVAADYGIKSIVAMGQDAGAFKMRFRATGLDLAAMRKLTDDATAMAKAGDKSKMGEAQVAAMFKSLAQNGATLHLDQLSWTYKGHELMVKGTIGFPANTSGTDIKDTLSKAEGQLTVRVPVALVKEVARTVAKNMPMGQPGQPVSEQQVEQHAATFGDMAIGKMLGAGFFRMDGEVLVSDVAFKGGKLTLNGVVMDMPKPPVAPKKQ